MKRIVVRSVFACIAALTLLLGIQLTAANAWSGTCNVSTYGGCHNGYNANRYGYNSVINMIVTNLDGNSATYDFNLAPGQWTRDTQNPSTYNCYYNEQCVKGIRVGAGWCVTEDVWTSTGWQNDARLFVGPGDFWIIPISSYPGHLGFRATAFPC